MPFYESMSKIEGSKVVPVLALQLVLRRFAEPVPVNVSFLRMTMQRYYFNLIWASFR